MRLFVAIELPGAAKDQIRRCAAALRHVTPADTRWVKPEGAHVTLKFLGDIPATEAHVIESALTRVVIGHSVFQLGLGALRMFPSGGSPRALFSSLTGETHALTELQRDVEQELIRVGLGPEERDFNAHVTLARFSRRSIDRPVGEGVRAAVSLFQMSSTPFRVGQVSLMRSHLSRFGASYTRVVSVPLAVA